MTEIITTINQRADQWWQLVVPNSIQLLILLVILLLLSMLFRKKAPLLHYSLWMILLIKALIPFQFQVDFLKQPTVPNLAEIYYPIMVTNNSIESGQPILTVKSLLFILWGIICAILVGRLLYRQRAFAKILKNTHNIGLYTLLDPLQQSLGIDRQVEVRAGPQIPSPFARGVRYPIIYLPENILSCNYHQLQAILAHELAHIKRHDMILIYLQNILHILYFFHPAVWIGIREINLQREKICDEIALHTLKENPTNYGKTLLKNLEYLFTNQHKLLFSSNLFCSKKVILKRFEYLFNKKEAVMLKLKKSHYLPILMMAALTILLTCNGIMEDNTKTMQSTQPSQEITFDTPPRPKGGFGAIQKNIEYPQSALNQKAEGKVIVSAFIDQQGIVQECKVAHGSDNYDLNQAAVNAVQKTQFEPAQIDENPVAVRISIPVVFKIEAAVPEDTAKVEFVPFDAPPEPVGGFEAIRAKVKYPQLAQEAGIEGAVIIRTYITERGEPQHSRIIKGIPYTGLNEAAIQALQKSEFKPARQAGDPVGVWITLPIKYKLSDKDK